VRRLDVVLRVADHHGVRRFYAGFLQRRADDVRIGLGVLRIVARRRDVDQGAEVAACEQAVELRFFRRRRNDDADAARANRFEQFARPARRRDRRQFALLEDARARLADRLALRAILFEPGHEFRQHFVAAHPDERAHAFEGYGVSGSGE